MIQRFACVIAFLLAMPIGPASAQDQPAATESFPFEDGVITITENADFEKVLAFDGEELARNFYVSFDNTVEVAGVNVALVSIGDGGNMCGPYSLIIWKPEGEDLKTQAVGDEDCGAPSPAVTGDSIYYVPYLVPGASGTVQVWTPETGLGVAGSISYTPQPGTRWRDFDPGIGHILDAMKNADIYAASKKLLGKRLTDVVDGLMVGSGPEPTSSRIYYAKGCVPHNCGGNDAFMGIDPAKQRLYFARQQDNKGIEAWPPVKSWPKDLRAAMEELLRR